ncbi:MAG: leucine-rich repeat protein, partial [Oscillospiraceae bacterium]|nr:leucine-rich repeat protein [Oscillospiraceae bacterium]
MEARAISHLRRRICAGITAGATGAVMLLQFPASVFAAEEIKGTTKDGFDYTISEETVIVTGYSGEDKETVTALTVPDTISGTTVTKIGRGAFQNMPALSSIKLPEGLQRLEDNIFWGDESLKELTLPKGIPLNSIASYSYIGGWGSTFRESYIEKIILEDGAQYVPTNLCYGSEHIRTVVIPDTVTEIGGYAFQCASVSDIKLPDSIKKIGQHAFQDSGITEIELPHGLTEIGSSIFENCAGITALVLPATVTAARFALSNSSVETLTVADGMETVPELLASGAESLKTLYLPRSVTAFGYGCFEKTAITEFTVPKQVTAGESVFMNSALKTVSFEDGLTKIPDKFFKYTPALKTINWNPDITEVGEYAFQYSGLETLAIPDTVQKIGYNSF